MDDTSSNGPLAAAQAWNEKQANAFRRGEIPADIVACLAWLTASLQAEEAARAELQDELARLKGGAK
jgi:hypothetical protein